MDDSNDFKKSTQLLLKDYPRREPLHLDVVNVLKSIHFEQIMKITMVYPEMFKLICAINPLIGPRGLTP